MPLHIISGAQWGDEGKGRIVDWYAAQADYCARFNGGDNAGHTVTVGEHIFKLHLVPSGIIHPRLTCALGNGLVINPATLFEEMDSLQSAGIDVSPARLRVSFSAHLITPAHQALDRALEAARGARSLGTTGRGIGPAYTDKASRLGLRVGDMLASDFHTKVADHVRDLNRTLLMLGSPELDPEAVSGEYDACAARLQPYIADVSLELHAALQAGKTILAEGAQGLLLDLDHGTYPFVTSSSTSAPAALTGLGLGMDAAASAHVTGVVKAYQTRVGSGPFPTELFDDLANRLRGSGANPWDEYGTTTGRPRRVGWLDGVLLRYASRLSGFTSLAVTKLDILSGIDPLQVCVAYEKDGTRLQGTPPGLAGLASCQPVYEQLPGWSADVSHARHWRDLPPAAQSYLERLSDLAGVPLGLVSVGPERDQLIEIQH